MRHALSWFALGVVILLVACAQGSADDDDDGADAAANVDARPQVDAAPLPDARVYPDAPPIPDAAPIPDSPISSIDALGGLCNSNADCPAADDCCFVPFGPPGFCVLGTEDPIFGCLPN